MISSVVHNPGVKDFDLESWLANKSTKNDHLNNPKTLRFKQQKTKEPDTSLPKKIPTTTFDSNAQVCEPDPRLQTYTIESFTLLLRSAVPAQRMFACIWLRKMFDNLIHKLYDLQVSTEIISLLDQFESLFFLAECCKDSHQSLSAEAQKTMSCILSKPGVFMYLKRDAQLLKSWGVNGSPCCNEEKNVVVEEFILPSKELVLCRSLRNILSSLSYPLIGEETDRMRSLQCHFLRLKTSLENDPKEVVKVWHQVRSYIEKYFPCISTPTNDYTERVFWMKEIGLHDLCAHLAEMNVNYKIQYLLHCMTCSLICQEFKDDEIIFKDLLSLVVLEGKEEIDLLLNEINFDCIILPFYWPWECLEQLCKQENTLLVLLWLNILECFSFHESLLDIWNPLVYRFMSSIFTSHYDHWKDEGIQRHLESVALKIRDMDIADDVYLDVLKAYSSSSFGQSIFTLWVMLPALECDEKKKLLLSSGLIRSLPLSAQHQELLNIEGGDAFLSIK